MKSALTRPVLRFSIPFHRSVLKVRGTKIDLFFSRDVFFFLFLLFLKIHKKLKVRYIVAQYKKMFVGVHKRSHCLRKSLALCPLLFSGFTLQRSPELRVRLVRLLKG